MAWLEEWQHYKFKSDQLWLTPLCVVEKEGREIVNHSYSRTYGRNCQTRRENTKKLFFVWESWGVPVATSLFRDLCHTTKPTSHSQGSYSGPIQEIDQP